MDVGIKPLIFMILTSCSGLLPQLIPDLSRWPNRADGDLRSSDLSHMTWLRIRKDCSAEPANPVYIIFEHHNIYVHSSHLRCFRTEQPYLDTTTLRVRSKITCFRNRFIQPDDLTC